MSGFQRIFNHYATNSTTYKAGDMADNVQLKAKHLKQTDASSGTNGTAGRNKRMWKFGLELDTLERQAKSSMKATNTFIQKTAQLKKALNRTGRIQMPMAEAREQYDRARYALERVTSSEDPDIRRRAFNAMRRDVITMQMLSHSPYGDVREWAVRKLESLGRPNRMGPNELVEFPPARSEESKPGKKARTKKESE